MNLCQIWLSDYSSGSTSLAFEVFTAYLLLVEADCVLQKSAINFMTGYACVWFANLAANWAVFRNTLDW